MVVDPAFNCHVIAEAEYYALVEGATRSLGLQSMMRELGLRKDIFLQTDSSAAKSFASQRGLGRMRRIEVKDLWLQEAICRSRQGYQGEGNRESGRSVHQVFERRRH